MPFSITAILHPTANKQGLHKVNIQVIYQRKKVYAPTNIKVPKNNFEAGSIVKHLNKGAYNGIIREEINKIELRLLDTLRINPNLTKTELNDIVKGNTATNTIEDYIVLLKQQLTNKFSEGRIKQFSTIIDQLHEFAPGVTFRHVTVDWMNRFESWLRTQPGRRGAMGKDELMRPNTVRTKMTMIKSILNKAAVAGLVDVAQFKHYKMPPAVQVLPTYLNEAEMAKMFDFLQAVEAPKMKLAGYYFLLGCYAGFRISDQKAFKYDGSDTLVLKARKNNTIVSIPVHTRLRKILEFIKDKPLAMAEPTMRKHVKTLATCIGLTRNIVVNSGRHSFAMMLMERGVSRDKVAELIGDTVSVAKVYARVSNKSLQQEILDKLG